METISYILARIFTSISKEVLMNNFWNFGLILKVSKPKHIYMSRATSLSVFLTFLNPSSSSGSWQKVLYSLPILMTWSFMARKLRKNCTQLWKQISLLLEQVQRSDRAFGKCQLSGCHKCWILYHLSFFRSNLRLGGFYWITKGLSFLKWYVGPS